MKLINKKNIKRVYNVIVILILLLGVAYVFGKFVHFGNVEYTDNAQVYRHITPVNARVQGFVKEIRFEEFQEVHRGDTLVIIEDTEYLLQLSQAESNVASAESGSQIVSARMNTQDINVDIAGTNVAAANAAVSAASAAVESSGAVMERARAVMENAKADYDRYSALLSKDAVTRQQYDNAKLAYEAAKAQYDAARGQYDSSKAEYDAAKVRVSTASGQKTSTTSVKDEQRHQLSQSHASADAAKAGAGLAKLRLSYTVIVANCDGKIGRKTIHEGQFVQPGQMVAEIVDSDDVWITANYRESQLCHIKVGNKACIVADAVAGVEYKGVVEVIAGATGAAFAKQPVDNAVGNFVKVEQRVPVKIKLTEENAKDDIARLLAGLNVETEVEY